MLPAAPLRIRTLNHADECIWRELWRGYCDFYGQELGEETTSATWQRLLSPDPDFRGLVAEREGSLVAFANLIIHANTWSTRPVCYLEDLYVAPPQRGRGVGHALITHLIEQARAERWSRLYWVTRADNVAARRLYDHFVAADGYVRYAIRFAADGTPG